MNIESLRVENTAVFLSGEENYSGYGNYSVGEVQSQSTGQVFKSHMWSSSGSHSQKMYLLRIIGTGGSMPGMRQPSFS